MKPNFLADTKDISNLRSIALNKYKTEDRLSALQKFIIIDVSDHLYLFPLLSCMEVYLIINSIFYVVLDNNDWTLDDSSLRRMYEREYKKLYNS